MKYMILVLHHKTKYQGAALFQESTGSENDTCAYARIKASYNIVNRIHNASVFWVVLWSWTFKQQKKEYYKT